MKAVTFSRPGASIATNAIRAPNATELKYDSRRETMIKRISRGRVYRNIECEHGKKDSNPSNDWENGKDWSIKSVEIDWIRETSSRTRGQRYSPSSR